MLSTFAQENGLILCNLCDGTQLFLALLKKQECMHKAEVVSWESQPRLLLAVHPASENYSLQPDFSVDPINKTIFHSKILTYHILKILQVFLNEKKL